MKSPEGAGTRFPPHLLSHGRLSGMAAHKIYPHHLERTVKITVYTKPACPQCDMTKKWLDGNNVVHKTEDVSVNEQALSTVQSLGYKAAPVVIITHPGGLIAHHWSGFRPDRLAEVFKPKDVAA